MARQSQAGLLVNGHLFFLTSAIDWKGYVEIDRTFKIGNRVAYGSLCQFTLILRCKAVRYCVNLENDDMGSERGYAMHAVRIHSHNAID